MSLGRNDPCHCGSGRKYKKCCLAKDEETRHAGDEETRRAEDADLASAAANPQSAKDRDTPKPTPDPRIEARGARWSEFEAADYEGRLALFLRTLDDPELMDGEMAFEMLNQIFHETAEHRERNRFDALVESLRERRPEVYTEEEHYFLEWRINNALVAGRSEDVSTLTLELAPLAGKDIDIFNGVENRIAYHGHLSTLVEAMRLAWPGVKSSSNIVPWGIDEFCTRAMAFELLDYTDRASDPVSASPALLKRLGFYSEIDVARVAAYLAHLTGRAGPLWTMSDFEFAPPRRGRYEDEEESETTQPNGKKNLFHLTIEFLGYLRRLEGVPYAKGELARLELYQFILDRHEGKLEHRESMLNSMQRDLDRQRGHRPPPKRRFKPYEHLLLPDPERLEHFLVGLLGMMNQFYHRAAALFEIIPAWLRFLETRRLIDAEARVRTLSNLAHLAEDLLRVFDDFTDDPSPRQALEGWSEEAKKAIPESL